MDWQITFALDRSEHLPLSVQLARSITHAIRGGRLRPATKLPGARTLARALSISRNTVDAAYRELCAEGWITQQGPRGTFVSESLPVIEQPAPARPRREKLAFDLGPGVWSSMLSALPPMASVAIRWDYGIPDLRLAPVAELARAYRRSLSRGSSTLAYSFDDSPELKAAIAHMLASTRGFAPDPEQMVITQGSQMALSLIAHALLRPGDAVAVEDPGYPGAWEAFRALGAKLVPVPVDATGMRVDALEGALRKGPVRAIFATPHHQFPTTVTLAADRRLALYRVAKAARVPIIEDDYDHEFHYDGHPVLPLASADAEGLVIYVGSLSKIVAPGLRVGYVVGPSPLIDRLRHIRCAFMLQGNAVLEHAMADLLQDGELQRHWRRARRIYQRRRDFLVERLEKRLPDALSFARPSGGMAIWAEVAPSIDVESWARRALDQGLFFRTGRAFYLDGRARPHLRIGFAHFDEQELERAVDLLWRSL